MENMKTAAGCHSIAAVSGSDGNACKVALIERLAKTVNSLTLSFLSTSAAVRQALAAKRRLAQLVEHLSYTQQVTGSIPVSPSCSERIINQLTAVSTSARRHLETGAFLIQEGK